MIENEQQYQSTRQWADRFAAGTARLDVVAAHRSAEMRRVMREAMASQLEELEEQLVDYEVRHVNGSLEVGPTDP